MTLPNIFAGTWVVVALFVFGADLLVADEDGLEIDIARNLLVTTVVAAVLSALIWLASIVSH